MKKIEYYRKSNYGNVLEYVKDPINAQAITALTGKKTITEYTRKNIEALSNGLVQFVEVIAP